MGRVTIYAEEDDQLVGEYEFQHLPRKGDEISIAGTESRYDLRIFTVGEVVHIAAGAEHAFGAGPMTALRYCKEIL